MKATTAILALVGAATALVARNPIEQVATNTLIEYQRWCPVCDTVAQNYKCINEGASCRSSIFMIPDDDPNDCESKCSSTCQLSYVADSNYGYNCNVTRSATD